MIKLCLRGIVLAIILAFSGGGAYAAPGVATFVMDARTGEVLYARSADRHLAPASLTKMMTLYLVFTEIEAGRMSLDQMIPVSANAASEPPSKLGLRRGSRIQLRYLIRAAAIKSANDAATAMGEAVSGSEDAFARYMTETAHAMGMNNTQFRNANGLTRRGHYSSARDMALLGRRLFYDFPQYYNLFSRLTANAGIATVRHTNRRFLGSYPGADGIKTGYTNAAGFNLVASARHGQKRIIAVMFGGTSTAQRNARVTKLMDLGFRRAPAQAAVVPLPRLILHPNRQIIIANQSGAVARAARPARRAKTAAVLMASTVDQAVQAAAIEAAIAEANMAPAAGASPPPIVALLPMQRPIRRPETGGSIALAAVVPVAPVLPRARATEFSGIGQYSVQVGAFHNQYIAERFLIQTALLDIESFNGAQRSISLENVQGVSMYQARFVGMSAVAAAKACDRLRTRQSDCTIISPTG